jgi:hypothetical protein
MSEPPGPYDPPVSGTPTRVGDAERDKATEYLREHLAQGRLDNAEFEERLDKALRARTQPQLDDLFDDLPDPRPAATKAIAYQPPPWQGAPTNPVPGQSLATHATAPVPETRTAFNNAMAVVTAVAFPLAVLICFATSWQYWWIMLIPVMFSAGIKRWHQ